MPSMGASWRCGPALGRAKSVVSRRRYTKRRRRASYRGERRHPARPLTHNTPHDDATCPPPLPTARRDRGARRRRRPASGPRRAGAGHRRRRVRRPGRDDPGTRRRASCTRRSSCRSEATEPLPIILLRTPYGIDGADRQLRRATYKALADDGYIFVFQDIRGRFKSEGTFVMQRPARATRRHHEPRRGHRHLRHDRLAAEERAGTTTAASACSASRYLGWTTIMGAARAAPGAQGDLAAGLAGRHVARRRLPPQRRVPPELRVRVRRR